MAYNFIFCLFVDVLYLLRNSNNGKTSKKIRRSLWRGGRRSVKAKLKYLVPPTLSSQMAHGLQNPLYIMALHSRYRAHHIFLSHPDDSLTNVRLRIVDLLTAPECSQMRLVLYARVHISSHASTFP